MLLHAAQDISSLLVAVLRRNAEWRIPCRQRVRVHVERRVESRVPQTFLHHLRVDILSQRDGRHRVPGGRVEADLWDFSLWRVAREGRPRLTRSR